MVSFFRIFDVARNPKLLIPIAGFIAIGLYVWFVAMAPSENPLPDRTEVDHVMLAFHPSPSERAFEVVDTNFYADVRACFQYNESVDGAEGSEFLATMRIGRRDGSTVTARFYGGRFVEVGGVYYKSDFKQRARQLIEPRKRRRRRR